MIDNEFSPSAIQATTFLTDVVLVDVVNFTRLSDEDQLVTGMMINDGIKDFLGILPEHCLLHLNEIILSIIPTGDGFYVILNPQLAGYGPLFALSLRNDLLSVSKRRGGLYEGIRVVIHLGTALPFTDATGRKNYVGHGLNECERLIKNRSIRDKAIRFTGDKNYVLVSRDSWNQFNICFPMQEFGDFWKMLDFRVSDEFEFIDDHGRKHIARVIEISRQISIPPPRPRDALDRIKRSANGSRVASV